VLIFILELGLLLGVALLLGLLAKRLHMPAVAGELCAGILLGPSVLGQAAPRLSAWLLPPSAGQLHLIDAVGQLGVILLVGLTGISLDLGLLRRNAGTAATVGAGALLLPLGCGVAVGLALPRTLMVAGSDRVTFVAFIAVAMCVSAIPVIAKTLLEMRLLHRNVGQLIICAATVDDVIGWLLLSIVSAMATVGLRAHHLLLSIGWLALLIAVCLTLARPVVGLALRLSARSKDTGPVVATVVIVLLAFAAVSQAMGMEAIIGALFGGMVIGSCGRLDPNRLTALRTFVMAVLAPVFFATAGLRMNLTALGRPAVLGAAVLVLAVAIASKFAGAYASARAVKMDHWNAVALGAGLNARGVMEIILAIAGLQLGVLTTAMYTIIVLVAVITSVIAPPVLRFAVHRTAGVSHEELVRELALAGDYSAAAAEIGSLSARRTYGLNLTAAGTAPP
jgi:Kef-type K+ transport system membrane component KefB